MDLVVRPGEAVAVVGPSGAGKTTLLRVLNGTVIPRAGTARFAGVDLAAVAKRDLRTARARVGFVHQDHSLVPTLRVSQNVIAGKLGTRGFWRSLRSILWPRNEDIEAAYRLLDRVGIPEKLFQRTDTLSGGQQQRVALARALFQEPEALLADEPVASVDPARGRDLLRLIRDVAAESELTLFASMHDLELARDFFPRMIGLRDGRVHFDRPTAEIDADEFDDLYSLEGRNGDVG